MNDILLITPPFTQLNTPYPATAYLKGFLNSKNISSFQVDLGLEVILKLFSKDGLKQLFSLANNNSPIPKSENSQRILALQNEYINTIEGVVSFLQEKNQTLARLICTESFLPQASRFNLTDDLNWAFGTMGMQDKAKHMATLYLEDISDFIIECIDHNFGFSRYAERLGRSANSFDELSDQLKKPKSFIDKLALNILEHRIKSTQPKLVAFSVPFPGNLFSAFRCAQYLKIIHPEIKTVMGGGFPTTELRSISDARPFKFFDYITLDGGELPIELIYEDVLNNGSKLLKRTFVLENQEVVYNNTSTKIDYKQSELSTPDYSDLLLNKYISVIEVTNPMHSLWSDGRWNKLTMTYGCYWGKCTFCDGSLDYIKNLDPINASILVDRMEQIIEQTGERGFHFVDEAAHPTIMKSLALEIIRRNLTVTWWTNIRFEKSFSYDICQLLKASGCIAVSGGLEVASDRLLGLINKGVNVEQVAKVTSNFTESGIMVHAYLMYGFPSQTVQETIDSLEMVRQMFEIGIIQSGFWHQFALTAHSPIGLNANRYNIEPEYKTITFANNDIQFKDSTGINHDKFSFGLKKSLYNYMLGTCFDFPLQEWFEFKIPKTTISNNFIRNSIEKDEALNTKTTSKIIWLGGTPLISAHTKSKKGKNWEMLQLTFHLKNNTLTISLDKDKGEWFVKTLEKLSVHNKQQLTFEQLKADYENIFNDFELFWFSKPLMKIKKQGLLTL